MCVASGRTRVSSWTWSEGVVDVLPVAIRSAAFAQVGLTQWWMDLLRRVLPIGGSVQVDHAQWWISSGGLAQWWMDLLRWVLPNLGSVQWSKLC